jgi:glucose/arabinose dehydrogenase
MHTRFSKWSLVALLPLTTLSPSNLFSQISDPIPESITPSGILVGLEDVIQAPRTTSSDPQGARARLNLLSHANDKSGRSFVNDMSGILYILFAEKNPPKLEAYLNLKEHFGNFHNSGWSEGFNSFAFNPRFSENGKFYTVHSEDAGSGEPTFRNPRPIGPAYQSVVVEWTAETSEANTFTGSKREIMRVDQPRTNHPIGQLGFNPNVTVGHEDFGKLYLASGDGGSMFANAPENLQRLDSVLGTIMRIDPFGTNSSNNQYGIPNDNPFVDDPAPTVLTEIWAYGFRNNHRFSWDTQGSQQMYISDIGEDHIEEINRGQPGANYGWPLREGTFMPSPAQRSRLEPLPEDDQLAGFTYPIAQYDHDDGVAITGGYVYRGNSVKQLKGFYLFGDIKSGRVFYFDVDQGPIESQSTIHELQFANQGKISSLKTLMRNPSRVDLRFGSDQKGEIYLLTKRDGMIRRIVPLGLRIAKTDLENLELRWSQGTLESAPQLSGPWTNLDATSPHNIIGDSQTQFYRLQE